MENDDGDIAKFFNLDQTTADTGNLFDADLIESLDSALYDFY